MSTDNMLITIRVQGLHSVFERFRGILHEGEIDKRVQFMIEGLFAVRKAGEQQFFEACDGIHNKF